MSNGLLGNKEAILKLRISRYEDLLDSDVLTNSERIHYNKLMEDDIESLRIYMESKSKSR